MVYEFDDIVKKQIDFYYKNGGNICDFTEYDEDSYINHHPNTCIFRYGNEIISNDSVKNKIIEYIKELRNSDKDAYLSTATIKPSEYEFHPLVNIHLHWYRYDMREDLTWIQKGVPSWPIEKYDYKKELTFNKTIKSILSVRKKTHFRDYLFSKLESDNQGIFRYTEYVSNAHIETDEDRKRASEFPTWNSLLEEYDKSIFAFVVETEKDLEKYNNCQISEKTLNAFMCGNIPILLGTKNNVKLLKDIGFYVWNDEFGFTSDDTTNQYKRVNDFINCYNNIKKLSFEESKNFWIKNQEKIQKNFDIASNLIIKQWN